MLDFRLRKSSVSRLVHGRWEPDEKDTAAVKAWMAYHSAADAIDGHIRAPATRDEFELCRRAAAAGRRAQLLTLEILGVKEREIPLDVWNRAKLEALRRLGK